MENLKKLREIHLTPKRIMALLFAVCCLAFVGYGIATRGVGDHKPPEIEVPQEPLQVSVHDGREMLLSGLTATDEHDGDVTASLVVESVSDLREGNLATATFAAFDEAHNVSKAQRTIQYTDYTKPHFTLSAPLIFAEGASSKVFDVIGAQDVLDGSLDDRVKGTLAEGDNYLNQAGSYKVDFRVTNSLGDTVHLILPVEIIDSKQARSRVELTDYLVYLKIGEELDPESYLKQEESDEDTRFGQEQPAQTQPEQRPIRTESNLNTGVPGTYTVIYYDESEHPLEPTRLMVIVEE